MTEQQIEARVEMMINSLDRKLMNRALTQAQYDAEVKKVDRWARREAAQ